ncbi:MAG: hypothetical protein GTO54_12030, partial [Nitrososphaeria archaeon]|nr:hypothetical protein [Nitrososphaeria archaeon]
MKIREEDEKKLMRGIPANSKKKFLADIIFLMKTYSISLKDIEEALEEENLR